MGCDRWGIRRKNEPDPFFEKPPPPRKNEPDPFINIKMNLTPLLTCNSSQE
jgi:hypothetical protein